MTPEQHNKYLAYSNFAYGGLFVLFALLMMVFFLGVFGTIPNGPPAGFIVFMSLFMFAIYGTMTIPSFIAGWALLKRKKWAKTAAIVSGVIAGANFPIGTAVCIYTFWFLFSEPGRVFFEQNNNNYNYALPPAQQTWTNQNWENDARRQREGQYQPPPPPPDWR